MLGGPGAGTNAGFWSRFVMVEGLGIWAMEFMHALTGFADLYPFGVAPVVYGGNLTGAARRGPNTQHVAYRGADNHIHEIIW